MLLARYKRKSFLHRIVTGDEKWIYFENPKRKRSWVTPGEPSTSTARPDRYGRKTMLCVWWDQKGVIYYELLKPGETINTERYRQQMINLKQPECFTSTKTGYFFTRFNSNSFNFMLGPQTRKAWKLRTANQPLSSLTEFITFLEGRCKALELLQD
jgi:hypothetical protein